MSSLTSTLYQFGEFSLDPQGRVLRRGQTPVALTPKAFDLLLTLIQNNGKIVTKDELMRTVWRDSFVEESNLTQTIFMVRKALDETSDRRYILTVQGQGYRFLIPITETATQTPERMPAESVVNVRPLPDLEMHPRPAKAWKWAGVATSVAVLLIAGSAAWLWRSRYSTVQPTSKIMLAVLPFDNFTGDPGQDYFSDGLTEEMISQLGNLDSAHIGVIARTSVMRYKHAQPSVPQVGSDLGVQYVIEGSVRRDSERVRITAQLIQVKDQSHLWAREYDRDLGHLLQLQEEIAREAANEIEFSLSGRRPIEVPRGSTAPPPAAKTYESYDLYLKGRYFWNKRTSEGFREAAVYFQQAIDKDPNFGRAYAGLADTFSLMSSWYMGPQGELIPKARAAALRALELDDNLADAHASLALIKENYDYNWPEAEKEFVRAIQLNPQYPTAHQWYAEFLSRQGRFQEAFAESERARQLDPLSLIIANDHARILYDSHQYEDALAQYRSVLDLDPSFYYAQGGMIPCNLELGRYDEAIDIIKRWANRERVGTTWLWAWEAAVYGRSGHADQARKALAELERAPSSAVERTAALLIAYSGTTEKDRVIDLLQEAYSEHSSVVVAIKVDPIYDRIRSDPRFIDLLRRMGLDR